MEKRAGRGLDLVMSLAALALGAPGCAGLALGVPPAEWPIPLHPQSDGEIALKTVVYLSGLLASYGVIGIVGLLWRAWGGEQTPVALAAPPLTRARREDATPTIRAGDADAETDGPVSIAEPLWGFLPASDQNRLARETGYQPLLYTKISILVSTAIGVLLAGSWEAVSVTEPIAPDAALRIGAGLYLMAESFRRYHAFARGDPSGTLVGTLVHGAARSLRVLGSGGSGGSGA